MELKKILSVSGQPDLFKIIKNTNKGIIVESILTQKRTQVFAHQRINSLGDIAVYTNDGEISLTEVFQKIYKKEEGKNAISHKEDTQKIKDYFDDFFPEYDRDRVKLSDMKRILKWYNTLNENGLVDDKPEETEDENTENEKKDDENKK